MRALQAMAPPGRGGWLRERDARIKLATLFCASLFAVILDSPWALGALCVLALLPAAFSHLGWRRWRLLLLLVGTITWGTMLSQAMFYYGEPRTVLLNLLDLSTPFLGPVLGEVNLYWEGFEHGAVQSLRISAMMVLGMTLCWTTDTTAMLGGLLAFRLPFVLAFMTVTAVRFLPIILQEFAQVALAWRLRGGRLVSLNPWRMVLAWLKITRPVLINCYRRSSTLALSIQTRAFSPRAARRRAEGRRLVWWEAAWIWFLAATAVAALAVKILYWLYLMGVHYSSTLRPWYEFCRLYF